MIAFLGGKKEDAGNNITALNKLEQKLAEFKSKIAERGIENEELSTFVDQLESELSNIKKGTDGASMERAESLVQNIEQKLSELTNEDALEELRSKIRKPTESAEEIKPAGIKGTEPEMPEQSAPEAESQELEEEAEIEAEPKSEQPRALEESQEPEVSEVKAEPMPQEAEQAEPEQPQVSEEESQEPVQVPTEQEPKESLETELEAQATEQEPVEKQTEAEKLTLTTEFNKEKLEELFNESVNLILQAQLGSGGILTTVSEERLHYVYPRHHLLATLGLIYAGRFEEAKKALEFAFHGQNKRTGALPQRWDRNGNDASYRKVEVDCAALFLYTFAEYVTKSADYEFAEHYWERIEKAVDFINSKIVPGKNLVLTPNSIHEYAPIDYGYEIWCNALCCAAFRELSSIAEKIRLQYAPLDKENLVKEAIMSYMWNSRIKSFIKTIKVEDAVGVILGPDASVLALSFFNVFNDSDERIKSTVAFLEENLRYKELDGLQDYPEQYGREYTGLGASPFFTLLLADHYVCLGDRTNAEKYLRWVLSVATEKKLPKYVATKEDFEALVSDLNDAGLLDRDTMRLIENTRKHADYANGIAHILEPYVPAHAMFAVVWSRFKEKFKEQ
ncbi:MAG: hypothetical protein J7J87_00420 [Candidatus Diapherotrites archaeon]|nr:hypothetical protein [Candidatus Diapherotrites archaeon]